MSSSGRYSQQTLMTCLSLSGLSFFLTILSNLLPSGYPLVAVIFYMSKTYGHRSDDTMTNSVIDLWQNVSRFHVHLWTPLCLTSTEDQCHCSGNHRGHSFQSYPAGNTVATYRMCALKIPNRMIVHSFNIHAIRCIDTNNNQSLSPYPKARGSYHLIY